MIIVTGAGGFIGSRLVLALNALGHRDIILVDTLSSPEKIRNLAHAKYLNILDPEEFRSRLLAGADHLGLGAGKPEVIFHQGACSDTTVSDAEYVRRVNSSFSIDLLGWCCKKAVPCIYASSAAVYGHGSAGFREDPTCEAPLNLYAQSKLEVDNWLRAHQNQFSSPVVGLRYFNVYGEQENHKGRMASVVYQFHHQILNSGQLQLFQGSDTFLRDFVHIRDVIAANLFFWKHPEHSGLFNVGCGEARSFLNIAHIMAEVHPGTEICFIPFPADLDGKYQRHTCADITQLRRTGFAHSFLSLEFGVADYAIQLRDRGGFLDPP